jgi:hypothetical protein
MNAYQAFMTIIDADVIEDRREYDVQMLMSAYAMTFDEATDLYALIQAFFEPHANAVIEEMDAGIVREYLVEAEHSDWDGWDERHKATLMLLIHDIRLYVSVSK